MTMNMPATQTSQEVVPTAKVAEPCAMVIFGATGDLTARKLMPALYNLLTAKLLNEHFVVIGVGRRAYTDEAFRQEIAQALDSFATDKVDSEQRDWILKRVFYVGGNFDAPDTYAKLTAKLEVLNKQYHLHANYFFYLATSPDYFCTITEQLGASGLAKQDKGWRRVVYEKPFGTDLKSATELNTKIKSILIETQIYRIDHYLGKETVQNIMVFRFGNGMFEPIWDRHYVDHVQITVAETVGVEQRGGYFEGAGTMRDMVPNHVMQLISLTAMEPPISFQANAVRDEQAKSIKAIIPFVEQDVITRTVRGQYGPGTLGANQVPGYRQEQGVAPDSKTETFVAMKLNIDNWRWAGVPFYIRTGKRMRTRHTEVAIQFKRPPQTLFRSTSIEHLHRNFLVMHISPDEGISLNFSAKIPGPAMQMGSVDMHFNYTDYFGVKGNTGYEVLLYDGMIGDQTLFQRADMVEAGWSVVDPVLDVWKALPARQFPNYAAGSWGPKEADELLEKDGRKWRQEVR
jgi:glucose-6-phosphate 1-dehydrogenase